MIDHVDEADTAELKQLLEKARINGLLRGTPDEPGQRLMSAAILALEGMEASNPGILAKRPRLALLLADIAKPCRRVLQKEDGR